MISNGIIVLHTREVFHYLVEIFLLLDTVVNIRQVTQNASFLLLVLAGPQEIHFATLFQLVFDLVTDPIEQGKLVIVLKN